MTANKDTNDSHQQPNDGSEWEDFVSNHSSELSDLEKSRAARKFEKQAEKEEKQRLLDAKDLTNDSFVRPGGAGKGPRDFQNSWLDVDDALGDNTFTPGPPNIGSMRRGTVVFAIMTLIGVLGLILVVFFPSIAPVLATISGVLTLIGAVGLFTRLRGHSETRDDPFDDGARV